MLIAQENDERETIQILSDEMLVVIPDLNHLDRSPGSGMGMSGNQGHGPGRSRSHGPGHLPGMSGEEEMIQRRYTKPCARFVGGVRVGFGFRFERTCREWSCKHNCGSTVNLARRRCRLFDFKRHQDVLLRNPQAIETEETKLGHVGFS